MGVCIVIFIAESQTQMLVFLITIGFWIFASTVIPVYCGDESGVADDKQITVCTDVMRQKGELN
jgi:hypothetical protein